MVNIWEENFIKEKKKLLSTLIWEGPLKLVSAATKMIPECSGVYCFVRIGAIEGLSPFGNNNYPLIVYIGRSNNLKKRLKGYIEDRTAVQHYSSSKRKVRDGIRLMFLEYGTNLNVYYSICPPDDVVSIEDALIQIFDPIFNSSQRLQEADFEACGRYISATITRSDKAYEPDKVEDTVDCTNIEATYGLDKPEPAF